MYEKEPYKGIFLFYTYKAKDAAKEPTKITKERARGIK